MKEKLRCSLCGRWSRREFRLLNSLTLTLLFFIDNFTPFSQTGSGCEVIATQLNYPEKGRENGKIHAWKKEGKAIKSYAITNYTLMGIFHQISTIVTLETL